MAKPQTMCSGDFCYSVHFEQILLSTFCLCEGVACSLPSVTAGHLQRMQNPIPNRSTVTVCAQNHDAAISVGTSGSTWEQCAWELVISSFDIHSAGPTNGGALHLKQKSFWGVDLYLTSWYWLQFKQSPSMGGGTQDLRTYYKSS